MCCQGVVPCRRDVVDVMEVRFHSLFLLCLREQGAVAVWYAGLTLLPAIADQPFGVACWSFWHLNSMTF